jgi:two-component system, OmpR family, phosphate regulon response regulator PhoB
VTFASRKRRDCDRSCLLCVAISSHGRHKSRIGPIGDVSDVLVIDPGEMAKPSLAPALLEAGHAVRVARTGAAGLISAREQLPDAVVLMAGLPDISGSEVCVTLKADPATRGACVIFIDSTSPSADRVRGLELGADDSVSEPFSVREVVLRIRALLRRRGSTKTLQLPSELLCIDLAAHRVLVHGRDTHVTALELRLLCALRDAGARVQTRQALLRTVWGDERGISTRTVDTHIKRLRRKLGPAASRVQSVRGVGYRFDSG